MYVGGLAGDVVKWRRGRWYLFDTKALGRCAVCNVQCNKKEKTGRIGEVNEGEDVQLNCTRYVMEVVRL